MNYFKIVLVTYLASLFNNHALFVQTKYECIDQNTNNMIRRYDDIKVSHQFQLFNEAPNISCPIINEEIATFKLFFSLNNVFGFQIENSKLFYLKNYNIYFKLEIIFQFVYLDFYRNQSIHKSNLVDMSSSRDLIASYHGLKHLNNLTYENISLLYDGFESMFPSFQINKLDFTANVFIRSKMSRIVFKNANIFLVFICKMTNTLLRRHLFEIVQTDDLFDFLDESSFLTFEDSNGADLQRSNLQSRKSNLKKSTM